MHVFASLDMSHHRPVELDVVSLVEGIPSRAHALSRPLTRGTGRFSADAANQDVSVVVETAGTSNRTVEFAIAFGTLAHAYIAPP